MTSYISDITPHTLQLKTMMMIMEWVWRASKEHLRVSMITMNNCKQVNQEERYHRATLSKELNPWVS